MLNAEGKKRFEELLNVLVWEDIEAECNMFESLVNKLGKMKLIDQFRYIKEENRLDIKPSPLLVHFVEFLSERHKDPIMVMAIIRMVSQKYSALLNHPK